jgi:uncharacterized membrane-anchored protein
MATGDAAAVRKWRVISHPYKYWTRIMEAERINAIGTQLSDLTARTLDLRGYL